MEGRITGFPSRRFSKWMVASVALLLLATVSPSAASARAHLVRTRLAFDTFGIINSDGSVDWTYIGAEGIPRKLACWGHRKTRFYREVPDAPDTLVGSKRSNFLGIAVLADHEPDLATLPGNYYAKERPVVRRTPHGRVRCSGARSNTVTVSAPHFLSSSAATERVRALSP